MCRHIPIHNLNVSIITTIDFSSNRDLEIDSGALDVFSNATYVDLSNTRLPVGFEEWLERKSRVKSLNISHCQVNSLTSFKLENRINQWKQKNKDIQAKSRRVGKKRCLPRSQ